MCRNVIFFKRFFFLFLSILFYSSLFKLVSFCFYTFDILIHANSHNYYYLQRLKITRAISNVNMKKRKKEEERKGEKGMSGMMINERSIRIYRNQCKRELFVNETTRERTFVINKYPFRASHILSEIRARQIVVRKHSSHKKGIKHD